LTSGVVILGQFILFLAIGAMLYVYYQHAPAEAATFTVNGRLQTDRIFPAFIVAHLPVGVVGLVIAAVFAAAMSTLASSLNSSAAAAMADFYMPAREGRSDVHYLRVSKLFTALWGVLQIGVAFAAIQLSSRVVDEVLGIASFTNGIILGLFLLGTFTVAVRERGAFAGVVVGASVMLAVKLFTAVSWQWYVLIGSLVTLASGMIATRVLERPSRAAV
jgi:Na+/proline symporter